MHSEPSNIEKDAVVIEIWSVELPWARGREELNA
jgi:hypothetical protein